MDHQNEPADEARCQEAAPVVSHDLEPMRRNEVCRVLSISCFQLAIQFVGLLATIRHTAWELPTGVSALTGGS